MDFNDLWVLGPEVTYAARAWCVAKKDLGNAEKHRPKAIWSVCQCLKCDACEERFTLYRCAEEARHILHIRELELTETLRKWAVG